MLEPILTKNQSPNQAKTVVQLSTVSIYQKEYLILTDINMQLHRGEFVYLIGKTGSGKSSLLKTLYGELPLKKGKATVAEFDLRKLSWEQVPQLRRKLGMVFQDFNLLMDRTVDENLRFVLKATGWKDRQKMKLRIDEVLDKVGLKTKGFKMPHELSGGEQQRVAIARALINHPQLILADEPTGNLDPETSDEIILLLREIATNEKATVLMATHDYQLLEKFPARIIRCQGGRLLDQQNFDLDVMNED